MDTLIADIQWQLFHELPIGSFLSLRGTNKRMFEQISEITKHITGDGSNTTLSYDIISKTPNLVTIDPEVPVVLTKHKQLEDIAMNKTLKSACLDVTILLMRNQINWLDSLVFYSHNFASLRKITDEAITIAANVGGLKYITVSKKLALNFSVEELGDSTSYMLGDIINICGAKELKLSDLYSKSSVEYSGYNFFLLRFFLSISPLGYQLEMLNFNLLPMIDLANIIYLFSPSSVNFPKLRIKSYYSAEDTNRRVLMGTILRGEKRRVSNVSEVPTIHARLTELILRVFLDLDTISIAEKSLKGEMESLSILEKYPKIKIIIAVDNNSTLDSVITLRKDIMKRFPSFERRLGFVDCWTQAPIM